MKRIASLVAATFAVVLILLPTAQGAPGGSCSVSPQQVPLGGSFTLSATGLAPNVLYSIEWDQAGPRPQDKKFDDISTARNALQSDASGNASGSFTTGSTLPEPLEVGPVNVKLRPVGQGTSQPVICGFEVVP